MNILDVVFLALGAISVYTAWTKVRAWHNLRHIPGPSWARWSHLWLVKQIFAGVYVDRLQELHARHGPVVLLSPDMVAVGDPRAIREISNPRSAWGRGPLYLGFRTAPGEDSLFSQPDRKAHEVLRKKLVGGYSGKSIGLAQVHAMIDERVLKLIELIGSKYVASVNGDQTFDLSRLLKYFTTDTISSFAFQRCFGCLDRDGDFHNYLQMTSKIAPPMVAMCTLPLFQKLQDTPSMKPFLPKGGFLKPILDIAREVVAERFGEEIVDRDDDVLGVWIANGLTQREAEVETVGQLAAGGETTATAIRATLLYLITSPLVYRKLQAEIDNAAERQLISSPITESEVRSMSYLQAVVKESLRIFPPVAMTPKMSASEETLCGVKIPAGTSVELSIKPALRDRAVFGQDADMFRPERWIESENTSRIQPMEDVLKFVFAGPSRWECLGKGIAMIQVHKVVCELVRQFDLTIGDPTKPWRAHGTRVWGIRDFYVKASLRKK
ncbi:hypothetical protein E8E14_003388 [Neopestalotiopsis sp. 37M]|nr:hypothetical protein E8E14_003388 [Neopestalotiopsis sp. 37M]